MEAGKPPHSSFPSTTAPNQMKSKERRSPGRSSRYDDYDRDSRRRRSRSRSYERYRSRSPSYDRRRRRSESPHKCVFRDSVFCWPDVSLIVTVFFCSSALVDGCMEEEEAGAVRKKGTSARLHWRYIKIVCIQMEPSLTN